MGRKKKIVIEEIEDDGSVQVIEEKEEELEESVINKEKTYLINMYDQMKARHINSISDIENQITKMG